MILRATRTCSYSRLRLNRQSDDDAVSSGRLKSISGISLSLSESLAVLTRGGRETRQRWDIKIVLKSRSSWRVLTVGVSRGGLRSPIGSEGVSSSYDPRDRHRRTSAAEIGSIPSSDFPARFAARRSSHLRKLPRISSPTTRKNGVFLYPAANLIWTIMSRLVI